MASAIDPFKNYLKAPHIQCPVLVMHGEADDVVPISNGKGLFESFPNADPNPLWIPDYGHNDMPEDECRVRVKIFLENL